MPQDRPAAAKPVRKKTERKAAAPRATPSASATSSARAIEAAKHQQIEELLTTLRRDIQVLSASADRLLSRLAS